MVWLAIWSNITLEPQCLEELRDIFCCDLISYTIFRGTEFKLTTRSLASVKSRMDIILDAAASGNFAIIESIPTSSRLYNTPDVNSLGSDSEWIRRYKKDLMLYTKDLSELPLEVCVRRRAHPLCKNIIRYYVASKLYDNVLQSAYQLEKILNKDIFDIENTPYLDNLPVEIRFMRSILDKDRHELQYPVMFPSEWDFRNIRLDLINMLNWREPTVSCSQLLQDIQFAYVYPTRYIKAIARCYTPVKRRKTDRGDKHYPTPFSSRVIRMIKNYCDLQN